MTFESMNLTEYQAFTRTTAIYPEYFALPYCVLGLVNEAGEVAGKLKKVFRDNEGEITEEKRQRLMDELSDVWWYLVRVCDELDLEAQQVMEHNVEKLSSRKERGVLGGSGDNR